MTKEEAIARFKGIKESMSISIAQSKFYKTKAELNELCDMAIESLSSTNADLIQRSDAIEVLMETIAPPSVTLDTLVMRIDALPSCHRCYECDEELLKSIKTEEPSGDLISRAEYTKKIEELYCNPCKENKGDYNGVRCRSCWVDDAIDVLEWCSVRSKCEVDAKSTNLISRADVLEYIDRLDTCGLGKRKALEYIRKYVERTECVSAERVGEWEH